MKCYIDIYPEDELIRIVVDTFSPKEFPAPTSAPISSSENVAAGITEI